jgi:YidC/Oxa1 family membrane protein insertase
MMVPLMAFFLWKAPVAIALYMATSSLWGMAERSFLRSVYAVEKFRLNPALQTTGA